SKPGHGPNRNRSCNTDCREGNSHLLQNPNATDISKKSYFRTPTRTPLDITCEQMDIERSHNSNDRSSFQLDRDVESQYAEIGVVDQDIINDGREDIVFKVPDEEPLLAGIDAATVQCIKVGGPMDFNRWGTPRKRLIFILKVIEPNAYAGTKLKMFVE